MGPVLDPFVLEYAPGPLVELHPSVVRLRGALEATLSRFALIPDERLTSAWTWNGNAVDVRYGFYRVLETIESAASGVGRALTAPSSEARDAVGATTFARWDLHGVLAGLADSDLDADPGGGEWTVRQTLGHIIGGQRGYAWGSAYWLSTRDQPRVPGRQHAPDELFEAMPAEEDEALGSLAEVRASLDDVVDATSSRYATLTPDEMSVMGGWSGFPVTIGFRMWRWPSHIEEHTVQVDKTLDMLGRRRTEVQRLLRLNAAAYGRLEALVFGRPAADLEAAGVPVMLESIAAQLDELAPSVGAAAEAGVRAADW